MNYIGRSVKRLEDLPLITGRGRFAADISFPNQVYMRVVRSPFAHGKLGPIDLSEALAQEGVVAIWTGKDVVDIPHIGFRLTKLADLEPYRQTILAQDRVRYVGEPIAVVFAESQAQAEDAAEVVFAEIDDLPVVIRAIDPVGEFLPGRTTEASVVRKAYGDIDDAFRRAAHVIELELYVGRHSGIPMETRGAIARFDESRQVLEMHGAAKVPHWNRATISKLLGLPLEGMHLYEGHVGGGFGIRGEVYPEDVLTCLAALRLKRPVKWIEDRKEHLLAANHSRDQHHRIRAAIDENGFILGIDDDFFTDQGGYVRTHAATVTDLACAMLPGPYVIPAYRAAGHIRLTNKTPAGTYRAPGRYETTFVRERLLDAVGHKVGIDPIEVRRRNLIPLDKIPFARGLDTLGTEVTYDSGDYFGLMDQALQRVGYEDMKKAAAERRAKGELVGIGVGYFVEKSGLGPMDEVDISVDEDGHVRVITGVASIGQGVETSMAQICAERLGASIDKITVIHGQTDLIGHGMGAFASRVTVMTGSAIYIGAGQLRERALQAAASLLQVPEAELEIDEGVISRKGQVPGPSVTLGDVVRALRPGSTLLNGNDPGLKTVAQFTADHMTYPYGFHIGQVRIDPETCGIEIEKYLVAYDIGKSINPMLVEGQLVGGACQGIGGALYEQFVYDEQGQPLATSFMDYVMPTITEMPWVDTLVREDAPSPLNPLGVKGAGEGGTNAVGATLAGAIDEALQMPGAITSLPVGPATIYNLLKKKRAA